VANPEKAAKQVNKTIKKTVAKTPANLARAVAGTNKRKK
jgi:hypothetical protein